jgi:Sigma-70 factor, region 1.1
MDWSEVVRKAVILGDVTGYLTFDQINDLITEPEKVAPEDIEALLTTLSDNGINVVDE